MVAIPLDRSDCADAMDEDTEEHYSSVKRRLGRNNRTGDGSPAIHETLVQDPSLDHEIDALAAALFDHDILA